MTIKQLIETINDLADLDITDSNRDNNHVACRCIFYDVAYNVLSLGSLSKIGNAVNKHHASVIHSLDNLAPNFDLYFPDHVYLKSEILDILGIATKKERNFEKENIILRKKLSMSNFDGCKFENETLNDIFKIVRRLPDSKLEILKTRVDAIVKMMTYEGNNI